MKFFRENICFILFFEFLKLGLFTIGGGIVMLPFIEDVAVNRKKWINQEEMMECITLGQSLPGVIAINAATYVGYKKAGFKGAFWATVGVIMPSFVIILALAGVINAVEDISFVQGAFAGIKACVTGLVACTAYNIGRRMLDTWFSYVVCAFAFICVVIFDINAIIIIICTGFMGIVYYTICAGKKMQKKASDNGENKGGQK